eukprot:CAMPEP_0176468740 /NCGR_PEP_ID=MMETSP0127-20121128/39318_1 /TAXON_ID=938130 /ORGANISM="Platyophrya macrostoma, Strain WH" /LENGTH=47 /DNA_ID= /DNA_START= /DNA_END= /DNA_ORIENTATION=
MMEDQTVEDMIMMAEADGLQEVDDIIHVGTLATQFIQVIHPTQFTQL